MKKLIAAALLSFVSVLPNSYADIWSPIVDVVEIFMDNSGDLIFTVSPAHGDASCGSTSDSLNRYRLSKSDAGIYDSAVTLIATSETMNWDLKIKSAGCIGSIPRLMFLSISPE